MSGWIAIAGLGPGDEALVTPEVTTALAGASDVIGYIPYVARVAPRDGLTLHPSDNRVGMDRAAHALELAARGRRVVVVSSGDPGVFAMAAALFEALEAGPANWRDIDIRVLPGITAMLAASARAGAPLGHDFCAINLSDNLKPWSLIEKRVRLAAAQESRVRRKGGPSEPRQFDPEEESHLWEGLRRSIRVLLLRDGFYFRKRTIAVCLGLSGVGGGAGARKISRCLVDSGTIEARIDPV